MPTTTPTVLTTKYLTIGEAAPLLAELTGLALNPAMLRMRIARAAAKPAEVSRMYLAGQGRGKECDYLREQDLPIWAQWLKDTV